VTFLGKYCVAQVVVIRALFTIKSSHSDIFDYTDMIATAQLDEHQIETLVACVYARVRLDALIGPVFNAAVGNWDGHPEKLVAFWSSVMLASGRYKGDPVAAHLKHLPTITPPMFDRWLALWTDVTAERCPPPQAAAFQAKAARIADSLKLALYFRLAPATAGQASASRGPKWPIQSCRPAVLDCCSPPGRIGWNRSGRCRCR